MCGFQDKITTSTQGNVYIPISFTPDIQGTNYDNTGEKFALLGLTANRQILYRDFV